jgi:hypothetical protein
LISCTLAPSIDLSYFFETMAGHVAPVPRHSAEFDRYEYMLQLSCRSTTARDINIWQVSNPALTAQFDRRSNSQLSVDCWVDITALDDSNAIQDVCKRGFAMPVGGEGLAFTTGTIKFDADAPEQRQFLLCSVAIGRSFVIDDLAAKRELPAGFDSLYLHMPESDGAGGDLYRHTYVVFDPAQVLPRCVVHFTFNPLERPPRRPPSSVNLAEIRQRVAEALSVLGPAAGAATEKMLMDIGGRFSSLLRVPGLWCNFRSACVVPSFVTQQANLMSPQLLRHVKLIPCLKIVVVASAVHSKRLMRSYALFKPTVQV